MKNNMKIMALLLLGMGAMAQAGAGQGHPIGSATPQQVSAPLGHDNGGMIAKSSEQEGEICYPIYNGGRTCMQMTKSFVEQSANMRRASNATQSNFATSPLREGQPSFQNNEVQQPSASQQEWVFREGQMSGSMVK